MRNFLQKWLLLWLTLLVTTSLFGQARSSVNTDFSNGIPSDWTQDPSSGVILWSTTTTGMSTGSGSLVPTIGSSYAVLTASNIQVPVKLITGFADAGDYISPILNFTYAQPHFLIGTDSYNDTLKVYYRTSATGAWTLLETLSPSASTWTNHQISLEGITNLNNIQVAFEYNYGSGRGIALDEVYIGAEAICTTPTGLRANRITSTTAQVLWNGHNMTNIYSLKVSSTQMTDLSVTADVFDGLTVDFFQLITGLTPSTTYYFYVKADCGDGDITDWSDEGTFTTLCLDYNVPLFEGFEGYGTTSGVSFPTCWNKLLSTYNYPVGTSPTDAYTPYCATTKRTGSASLTIRGGYYNSTSFTAPRITKAIVSTPPLNVTDISDYQVSFYVYGASLNYPIYIGVMSDPNDEASFQELAEYKVTTVNTWEEVIVPLSNATEGKFIAFMVDGADIAPFTTSTSQVSSIFYIDDVDITQQPACPTPMWLTVTDETQTTAVLDWASRNSSSWDIRISTYELDSTATQGDVFNGTMSTKPYTITGLNPNGTYYAYIRSNCATDGYSDWSKGVKLYTECSSTITTLPFIADFDNIAINDYSECWYRPSVLNNYPRVTSYSTSAVHSKPHSLEFRSLTTSSVIAATPAFQMSLNSLMVSFWLRASSSTTSGTFDLGYMTDPNDASTFVVIKSLTSSNTLMKYYEFLLNDLNIQGTGHHLAFRHSSDSEYSYYYLDDLKVEPLPTCYKPINVGLSVYTDSSAIIRWDHVPAENSWEVKVSSVAMSDMTVPANVFNGTTTTNSCYVPNLAASTLYYVYVRSSCHTDVTQGWSELYSFTTKCPSINTIPYVDDFDSYADASFPSCWSRPLVSSSYPQVKLVSGNNVLRVSGTTGINIFAATPPIGTELNLLQVSFDLTPYSATLGGTFEVGVMSDPNNPATFELVESIRPNVTTTKRYYVNMNSIDLVGLGNHIAFRVNGSTSTSYYWSIDNMEVDLLPTCISPSSINIDNVTSNSASLSWVSEYGETSWNLKVSSSQLSNPSAVTAPIFDGTLSTTSQALSGLQMGTKYYVYIQSNCSDTVGLWREYSFSTICSEVTILPYYTDLEGETVGAVPNCWSHLYGSKVPVVSNTTNSYGGSGNCIYFSGGNTMIVTPEINVDIHTVRVSFYLKQESATSGQMNVGVMSNMNDTSTFEVLQSIISTSMGTMQYYEFNLDSTVLTGNSWYLGFQQVTTSTNYWFWLDNVKIELIPSCLIPSDFAVVSNLDTMVSLSWSAVQGILDYELVYGPRGFIPSLSTMTPIVTTQTTVDIIGLSALTEYDFYIRTRCDVTDYSEWSNVLSVTTPATPESLPLLTDFEDALDNSKWTILNPEDVTLGKWIIGYGASPGLNDKKLYISTDTGVNAAHVYNIGESTYVYAYRTFRFDPGIYNIEYDWIGKGEVCCDYVRFALVDPSVTFEGGVRSNITTTTLPSGGWDIDLGGGVLNNSDSWQTVEGQFEITVPKIYNLVLYWANDGSVGTQPPFAIDNLSLFRDNDCKRPSDLSVSRLTTSSAKLMWSGQNTLAYNIKVSTEPIDPETQMGDIENITGSYYVDNYYDITDLTSNTRYFFYVQADCGDGTPSFWSKGQEFRTLCGDLSLPYTENFSGYGVGAEVLPMCWMFNYETFGSVTSDYRPGTFKVTPNGTDSFALRMQSYYYTSTNSTTGEVTIRYVKNSVILPKFIGNMEKMYMDFTASSSVAGRKLRIGVLPDAADMSSFILVDTVILGTTSQGYSVSFEDIDFGDDYNGNPIVNGSGYITLLLDGSSDGNISTIYVNNVLIDTLAPCKAPSSIQTLNVTGNGATISWVPMSSSDSVWHVQLLRTNYGNNVNDIDTLTNFICDTVVTTNRITFTGLSAYTNYYLYIRPVCENNVYGPRFSQAYHFRTACGIEELPYSESFDTYGTGTGTFVDCWSRYTTNTSSTLYPYISSSYKVSSPGSLYFYGNTTSYTYAVLPQFNIADVSDLFVTFMARSSNINYYLQVGVMSDPTDVSTFTEVNRVKVTDVNVFEAKQINMASYTGTGQYIAIKVDSLSYFYIDDLVVEVTPSCLRPINLVSTGATSNSVSIHWDVIGTESAWDVVCGSVGFDPNDATIISSSMQMVTINSLLPSSVYEVYVRANCGDTVGVSSWVGPLTVYTSILPTDLPYYTDFSVGHAWGFENGSQTNYFIVGNDANNGAYSNGSYMYITNDNGTTAGYTTSSTSSVYAYKTFNVPVGTYQLSYKWKAGGESVWDYGRCFIAPSGAVLTPGSTVNKDTVNIPSGWLDLNMARGAKRKMNLQSTWKDENIILNVSTAGEYMVIFGWYNDASSGIAPGLCIDDFFIEPYCLRPTTTIDSVRGTSAKISWVRESATSILKISTTPIAADDLLTTVADVVDSVTTDLHYYLSGLSMNTKYYVYIRNICDTTLESAWISSSFITPGELPYSCDFESSTLGWLLVNGTQQNQFYIGAGAPYNGENSLYISADSGLTNSYSTQLSATASTVYAYTELYFTPGTFDINYQWRCQGEALNDYARVFLVPRSVSLTSGTNIMSASTIPTGATCILDGGVQLNGDTAWQTNTTRFTVVTEGIYRVVVGWRNNATLDNNPPIAIDDIVIEEVECIAPMVTAKLISGLYADIEWSTKSDTILYKVSQVPIHANMLDTITTNLIYDVKTINKTERLSGLLEETQYYVYSRVICISGDTTEWFTYSFRTSKDPLHAPVVIDFESDFKFTLLNDTQANSFVVGTAANNSGARSLYVSQDGGVSNTYDGTSTSYVYAVRDVEFGVGIYNIDYFWRCEGESSYDYGRVYLAPKTASISAGTSLLTTSTTPTGWISLDGGAKLNLAGGNWNSQENEIVFTEPSIYQLVIGWRNDGSISHDPAFAIDDIRITKVLCAKPEIVIDSLTSNAIYYTFIAGVVDSFDVFISSDSYSYDALDTMNITRITTNSYDATGLLPQTSYNLYVRSLCNDSTYSDWKVITTMTGCSDIIIDSLNSYVEDWDSYTSGTLNRDEVACWYFGTNSTSVYPYVNSVTIQSAPNSLYMYGTTNIYSYAATSRISGSDIRDLELNYYHRASSTSYYLLVGVMTNPNDISTFVAVDTIYTNVASAIEKKQIYFSNYTGTGKYIAFKTSGTAYSYVYIDDIEIKLAPSCRNISNLQATNVTSTNITLTWNNGGDNSPCEVKLFRMSDVADLTQPGTVADTIVTGNTVSLAVNNGIYVAYVRKICSATEQSDWNEITVLTSCSYLTIPYYESLSAASFPPTCWRRSSTSLASAVAGTALNSSTSGWSYTSTITGNTAGFSTPHVRVNLYGSSSYYWLTTPSFYIDTTAILSFDLALTPYSSSSTTVTVNDQQSFAIVISDDGGSSWSMSDVTLWNDSTGDYTLSGIPQTGARYSVDLAKYIGDNIMIGFYMESKQSGGDNYLHLRDVAIRPAKSSQLYDNACMGYGYIGHGFNVASSEMPTPGVYSFSRVISGASVDSVVTINITVHPNTVTNITDSMCAGDVYTKHGFQNITTAGTYRRVTSSSYGCDSALVLTLTIIGGVNNETVADVCEGDLPYTWRGKNYNATGVYSDTIVGSNGCDVVYTLILQVNREYHFTDYYQIADTVLPFIYLDTVFTETTPHGSSTYSLNRKTAAGCDSIYTVTLDVRPVSLSDVYGNDFLDIYPNPIRKDGEVIINANLTDAELRDLEVEVFNSAGERVKLLHPDTLPIRISDFEASGVYMVRVKTNSNRIIYGKVIVK